MKKTNLTYFQQKVLFYIFNKGPVCRSKANFIYIRYRGPQRKKEFDDLITEGYLIEEIVLLNNGNLKRIYTLSKKSVLWVESQAEKGSAYGDKNK